MKMYLVNHWRSLIRQKLLLYAAINCNVPSSVHIYIFFILYIVLVYCVVLILCEAYCSHNYLAAGLVNI